MDKVSITAIILTYNESLHLQRCLNSLKSICQEIVVVDSFSTDDTRNIAINNGARFIQNVWVNHAIQFNWALDNANIKTDWVLRLDADEYLTKDLQHEIAEKLPKLNEPINGIVIPLKRIFMKRNIKYGMDKIRLLRLFRNGKANSEIRWMDEHIQLFEGETINFEHAFADDNLKNIGWWTEKHNGYSIREAIDLLDMELGLLESTSKGNIFIQAHQKRKLKYSYVRKPLFLRAFLYFLYRYIIKLGFLDGKEGFLWHFLQGWWYRTLVDAKIYQIKKACGNNPNKIKNYIKLQYNIDLNSHS